MKDEADNKTVDWILKNIHLVSFDEDGYADFEVEDLIARCHLDEWDLNEFINGQFIIKPFAWFDVEGYEVDEPSWFNGRDLFNLNNVFERDFKKFRG